MRKQRLLENEKNPEFIIAIWLIILFLLFSLLNTIFINKFIPKENIDLKIIFGGTGTLIIETLTVYILFQKYRKYFQSIFSHPISFFKGVYSYFLIIPVLFGITFISIKLSEIFKINYQPQEIISFYFKAKSPYVLFFLFFLSNIIAPFAEEIIFRGIIFSSMKKIFSSGVSIFLSAVIFSLFHNELFGILGLFFLGIVLAYLFEKYGTLWASIGLHFFNNFVASIVILFIKFSRVKIGF